SPAIPLLNRDGTSWAAPSRTSVSAYGRNGVVEINNWYAEIEHAGSILHRLRQLNDLDNCSSNCAEREREAEALANLWTRVGFNPQSRRFESPRAVFRKAEERFWQEKRQLDDQNPGNSNNATTAAN